jgi:hypothetical protein
MDLIQDDQATKGFELQHRVREPGDVTWVLEVISTSGALPPGHEHLGKGRLAGLASAYDGDHREGAEQSLQLRQVAGAPYHALTLP